MTDQINAERLWKRLETLAGITDPHVPYTRRSFTQLHLEGRDWLKTEFESAGLSVRLDTAANMIGRKSGREDGLAPIVVGSHSDTVPAGGRFDGIAGVLAGLEVVSSLADKGMRLRHPLEIIDFLAEEPSVFGMSCVGSRIMGGHLSAGMLDVAEPSGETLGQAIRRMGGNPDKLDEAVRKPGDVAGYAELHIEQGRVLQEKGIPVGVVTEIVGITRYNIVVAGRADHAGNTPMALRQDALAAASALVLFAEQEARNLNRDGIYFVGTVGQLNVTPNATNVVPGGVQLGLEFRSGSNVARQAFIASVQSHASELASQRGVTFSFDLVSDADPAVCAEEVRTAIGGACQSCGVSYLEMPSGAGHDAMHVAAAGPMGMIFIPCRDGRSHCPEEWVEPTELAVGARVLYETVLRLDAQLP